MNKEITEKELIKMERIYILNSIKFGGILRIVLLPFLLMLILLLPFIIAKIFFKNNQLLLLISLLYYIIIIVFLFFDKHDYEKLINNFDKKIQTYVEVKESRKNFLEYFIYADNNKKSKKEILNERDHIKKFNNTKIAKIDTIIDSIIDGISFFSVLLLYQVTGIETEINQILYSLLSNRLLKLTIIIVIAILIKVILHILINSFKTQLIDIFDFFFYHQTLLKYYDDYIILGYDDIEFLKK